MYYFVNKENTVRFAHVLFVLTLAIKLNDASCKSDWNILVCCGHWKMMSDLNMFHGKTSDFV